jgi:hypothetical protein
MRARLSGHHFGGILVKKQLSTMCESVAISVFGVGSEVAAILVIIPATEIDLKAEFTEVKTGIGELKAALVHAEATIIKWLVAGSLTAAASAFTIARYVH